MRIILYIFVLSKKSCYAFNDVLNVDIYTSG